MIERANTLEAIKTVYSKAWKCGHYPIVEQLGSVALPAGWHDDEAERICRESFPQANGYAAYDEQGQIAVMAINLL